MKIEEFFNTKMADQQRWPGFIFLNIGKIGESVLSEMLKELDITANQWPVLHQIYEHEGSTQKELADYCLKDPSALMRSIDHLEKKNMVIRKNDKENRRIFRIYLTEKGEHIHKEALAIAVQCTVMACEGLTQEDLDNLYDIAMVFYHNWLNMKNNIEMIKNSGK